MSERLSAAQWSSYWSASGLTTFQGRFQNNYDGRVRRFWERLVELTADGAAVLDLATGNGALAALLAEMASSQGKHLELVGVDFADIAPAETVPGEHRRWLEQVRFLPGRRIEDTGLEDASFDLVVSQFGFEYGDRERTLDEIARLLEPGSGRFAAIAHHEDSAIVRQARDGVEQVALCEASGAADMVRDLAQRLTRLRREGQDPAADTECERLRRGLNDALGRLRTQEAPRFRDPGHIDLFLQNVMLPLNVKHRPDASPADKLDVLDRLAADFDAYRQRMADLAAAALPEALVDELPDCFASRGLTLVRSEPFVYEGTHFGHALVAER